MWLVRSPKIQNVTIHYTCGHTTSIAQTVFHLSFSTLLYLFSIHFRNISFVFFGCLSLWGLTFCWWLLLHSRKNNIAIQLLFQLFYPVVNQTISPCFFVDFNHFEHIVINIHFYTYFASNISFDLYFQFLKWSTMDVNVDHSIEFIHWRRISQRI